LRRRKGKERGVSGFQGEGGGGFKEEWDGVWNPILISLSINLK